jgi:hypothetical protein
MQDDAPNVYVTKRMIELLEKNLILSPRETRVPATGLRWLAEYLHLIRPRYEPIAEMPTGKTLRINRTVRMRLPNDT